MADHSSIEWTEATLNPWTGCTKVSPGCAHCYIARTMPFRSAGRDFVDGRIPLEFHMERLERMLARRKPTMYFVNSLSDVFHEDVADHRVARLFAAMADAPQHVFQILTKREARMVDLLRRTEFVEAVEAQRRPTLEPMPWPLPNVWMGVSVENRRFIGRADALRATPAAVRFISAEPLLGPLVNLADYYEKGTAVGPSTSHLHDPPDLDLTGVDWLIVGGESGPGHRPIRAEWVRDLRDACMGTAICDQCDHGLAGGAPCRASGCKEGRVGGPAFFLKQWGGPTPKTGGRELDGRTWDEMPARATVPA